MEVLFNIGLVITAYLPAYVVALYWQDAPPKNDLLIAGLGIALAIFFTMSISPIFGFAYTLHTCIFVLSFRKD